MKCRKYNARRTLLTVIVVASIMAMVSIVAAIVYAQSTSTTLNGQVSARLSTSHYTDDLRNELASLIWYAERLIGDTCVSEDGSEIPSTRYWANSSAHSTFQSAINSAQDIFASVGYLFPGDIFNATIRIDDNTGFAGMLFRVRIPDGVELIGTHVHDQPDMDYGLELPACVNNILASKAAPLRGDVFVGWAGRSTNFYGNGELFTLTFRVTDDAVAGQTVPIMIAFANGTPAYELPTDADKRELQISLPGGVLGLGESAEIGRVTFGQSIHELTIFVTPNHRTIVNRIGEYAEFDFTVTSLPPNQTFCLAWPTCTKGSACPAHPYKHPEQVAGIEIENLPNFISASGYVRTNNVGAGKSVFILKLVDTDTSATSNFEFGGVVFSSNGTSVAE